MDTTVACNICGLVQNLEELPASARAECYRCGSVISPGQDRNNSLQRTAAFSVAALVLYIPANIFPILRMNLYGVYSESTVWDGCVSLFRHNEYFVALIVFLASILIPLLKLAGLVFLVSTATSNSHRWQSQRTMLYNVIRIVGPWAMLDVFLLAILVSLVRLKELATVWPGPALPAFTAMVVLTILASASFDPRLIWKPSSDAEK